MSPLAGLHAPTPDAFADLAHLVPIDASVALFTAVPPQVPSTWTITRSRWIDQMISERDGGGSEASTLELCEEDVPDMLALAAATEPGPFSDATIRMGRYRGMRSADGRLVAMAGERLKLRGFTEISAVCTAPEFRGQGMGRTLVDELSSNVRAEGGTPFLHVKTENGAKRLYERLGFRVRTQIWLTVITHSSSEDSRAGRRQATP